MPLQHQIVLGMTERTIFGVQSWLVHGHFFLDSFFLRRQLLLLDVVCPT